MLGILFLCNIVTRPTRHAQSPQRLDHWLFGVIRGAFGVHARYSDRLRRVYSPHKWGSPFGPAQVLFKNASGVFVRRGADFRGVHAAHPAIMYTSARFFTPM
ncbi:hypothetical protein WCV01_02975 [Pectobacterium aroidearum]